MGRLSAFLLALILGGVGAVALTSCGGSDAKLLPGTTAEQIESNLDQVQQLVSSGDCTGAEGAVAEVATEVEALNVSAKLKAALEEGTAKLSEVVGRCEEEEIVEEPEPTLETDVEGDEIEDEKKPKKEKPEKEDKEEEPAEPEEEEVEPEGKELPPQAEGKGEEKAAEPIEELPQQSEGGGTPAGGVAPATGAE
jgi:hypothetical protein